MIRTYFLLFSIIFLSACGGYRMKYGVTSKTGVTFYPLCERAQQRITDMKRASFELSDFIKEAPCRNWPDYSYWMQEDQVNISLPAKVYSGDAVLVGGIFGLYIIGNDYKKNWYYYKDPIRMLDYYVNAIYGYRTSKELPNKYSWVERAGMRCLRVYRENEGIVRNRQMDYFCYESVSGYPFPIHLHAWERLPRGSTGGSDFEKLLIEPVLDSMEIYPADPEVLDKYHAEQTRKCEDAKLYYDSRGAEGKRVGYGINQFSNINYLQDCGYDISELPDVRSIHELVMKDGKVIGKSGVERHLRVFNDFAFTNRDVFKQYKNERFAGDVRLLSKNDFYKLKEILMLLRPRRIQPWFDYPGDWYGYVQRKDGDFGIRYDAEFGEVIDMTDKYKGHPRLSFIIDQ